MPRDADTRLFQEEHSFKRDLLLSLRIWRQFRKGFKALSKVENCVTFFGSARFKPDHPYYKLAYDTAHLLGSNGYAIMSGGGPGIMEASNRGAKDAGALSIGCNIKLPHEENANPYLDISVDFDHFFIRKVMLLKYSRAFVLLPGGYGTMDEIFETATLMQTGKICDFPIIAMGSEYWRELGPFLNRTMVENKTIDSSDLNFFKITDDPEEVMRIIAAPYECRKNKRF